MAAESDVGLRAEQRYPGRLVRDAARFPAWVAVRARARALAVVGGLGDAFALGRAVGDAGLVWVAANGSRVRTEAFGEARGVAVWNRGVFAAIGGAELVVFATGADLEYWRADAGIAFRAVLVLRAQAKVLVGKEFSRALALVRTVGQTGVVLVAAVMAAVRFLTRGCTRRFGTVTVAVCRRVHWTRFFAAYGGAFLRGAAALSGLSERIGDANFIRGGTGALAGELSTYALVFPTLDALGVFGTAVGITSGVGARCVWALGRFVHALSGEGISTGIAGFLGMAAISYVIDLADALGARILTNIWSCELELDNRNW